ncbi:unnamed protein product [Effrenium voratum]|nr:unnamed protein product [Effrenium voratum]
MATSQVPAAPALLELGDPVPLRVDSDVWEGHDLSFQKPGGGVRRALVVPGFAQAQAESLHEAIEECLPPSTGAGDLELMQCGEYSQAAVEGLLKPWLERQLLPLIRRQLPSVAVSSCSVRRLPSAEAECCADHGHLCTALLCLGAGGVLIQAAAARRSRRRLELRPGDLFLHHFDLAVAYNGRYLVVKLKDSLLSCLTNTAPWHDQLAQEGDADAQLALALQLEQRDAKPQEVIRWLRKSAEQGHAEAQACLGLRLGEEGLRWLHDAALQGHRAAQRQLAVCLLKSGASGEAQKWLRRAGEEDDLEAIELLVVCLVRAGSMQEALCWCLRGAELGSADLQHRAGLHLLAGEGCVKDQAAALSWLRRAAEQGHAAAQNNLGVILAAGLAGPVDLPAAQHHFAASTSDLARRNAAVAASSASGSEAQRLELSAAQRQTLQLLRAEVCELEADVQQEEDVKKEVQKLAALLQQLDSAASTAASGTGTNGKHESGASVSRPSGHGRGDSGPKSATPKRVSEAGATSALHRGEPFLLLDGMPWLSGQQVLEFMPRLMGACGKDVVSYEIQGQSVQSVQSTAPLAHYIQQIQRSEPGSAYFMMTDRLLQRPELEDLVAMPRGLSGDPERGARLSGRRWLSIGGEGAKTLLKRDPGASWHMLVLGRARWALLPPAGIATEGFQGSSEDDAFAGWQEVWLATQEMGEVMVVPPGWWYQVLLEDRVLSITAQFLAPEQLPRPEAQAESGKVWKRLCITFWAAALRIRIDRGSGADISHAQRKVRGGWAAGGRQGDSPTNLASGTWWGCPHSRFKSTSTHK